MLDFLGHDEVLDTLRRTDVFLQISTSEGFPNTLLEAMALGCTAIVTAVGAVPEVVGPGEATAFTVPIGDGPGPGRGDGPAGRRPGPAGADGGGGTGPPCRKIYRAQCSQGTGRGVSAGFGPVKSYYAA